MAIAPAVGASRPEMTRSSVVLPAPLAPMTATASPAFHAHRDAEQRLEAAVARVDVVELQHAALPHAAASAPR